MGDCYALGFVPVPRFLQSRNSVETLQKSVRWDYNYKQGSLVFIGMQKDYMCTSVPCQSSMDYENIKTTQHAQKHDSSGQILDH